MAEREGEREYSNITNKFDLKIICFMKMLCNLQFIFLPKFLVGNIFFLVWITHNRYSACIMKYSQLIDIIINQCRIQTHKTNTAVCYVPTDY